MRANGIVVVPPVLDFITGMIHGKPPMFIEALIANLAVEAFDIGVLIGFSGLDKLVSDLSFVSPGIQSTAGKLRAVVGKQAFGLATKFNELIQHTGYIGPADRSGDPK